MLSEISKSVYTPEDIKRKIICSFEKEASVVLFFLKFVHTITISEWFSDQPEPTCYLKVSILNAADVMEQRSSIARLVADKDADLTKDITEVYPVVVQMQKGEDTNTEEWIVMTNFKAGVKCTQEVKRIGWGGIAVQRKLASKAELNPPRSSLWMPLSGFGGPRSADLVTKGNTNRSMLLPFGGHAPQNTASTVVSPVHGRAFCFLPLPIETGLPVHVNGYFELSSNRRDLWLGTDLEGSGRAKAEWNKAVLQDVLAPLYADLIEHICAGGTNEGAMTLSERFEVWPVGSNYDRTWDVIAHSTLHLLWAREVFWSATNSGRCLSGPNSVFYCRDGHSDNLHETADILAANGFPLVELPRGVLDLLRSMFGVALIELNPSWARKQMQKIAADVKAAFVSLNREKATCCLTERMMQRVFKAFLSFLYAMADCLPFGHSVRIQSS